jgi:hypothetical protein
MEQITFCIQCFNRTDCLNVLLSDIQKLVINNNSLKCLVGDYSTEPIASQELIEIVKNYEFVTYYKHKNFGLDFGFADLIFKAQSEYCWILSDDDRIDINKTVVFFEKHIPLQDDIYIINAEVWSEKYTIRLRNSLIRCKTETDQEKILSIISFAGGLLIKKSIWIEHNLKLYNTFFNHAYCVKNALLHGASVRVIEAPLLRIRANNALWTENSFRIWTCYWSAFTKFFHNNVFDFDAANFNVKNLIYYYAYGALNDKTIKLIPNKYKLANVVATILMAINRKYFAMLVFFLVSIFRRSTIGEPQYYLLKSINTNFSRFILKHLYYENP